jgi:hypothetical protein
MGNFFKLVMSLLDTLAQGNKPSQKQKQKQKDKTEKISIIDYNENENSVSFILRELYSYDDGDYGYDDYACLIEKDGNPWVRIGAIGSDPNEFIAKSVFYHVKNYKWKEPGGFGFEYPKLVTQNLREQWQKVNGEIPPRNKTQAQPIDVNITVKSPVSTEIEIKSLKKWYKPREVEGSAQEPYLVDMNELTCTCPDFINVRSKFPVTDARRLCKHLGKIIRTFNNKLEIHGSDFVRRTSTGLYHGYPLSEIYEILIDEPINEIKTIYITKKEDGDWIDVMFPSGNYITGGGYNMKEKRWSYGKSPFPHGSKQAFNKVVEMAVKELCY